MSPDTKENSKWAKQKEKVQKNMPTEIDMSVTGKTINNTEAESGTALKNKQKDRAIGKMERDTAG